MKSTFASPVVLVMFMTAVAACSGQRESSPAARAGTASAQVTPPADAAPLPATPSPYDAIPAGARATMDKPFTGDLDALI
jgi:hypothetical protein